MGRLIPAGTGFEDHRHVQIPADEPPPPRHRSSRRTTNSNWSATWSTSSNRMKRSCRGWESRQSNFVRSVRLQPDQQKLVLKPRENAMRSPTKEFLLRTALICALGLTGHAQAPTPDTGAANRVEFRPRDRRDHAVAQARRLAGPPRQLPGLGLQSARPDQQGQRQDAAAGLVARHGARYQPGHAPRLQRRDVSSAIPAT